MQESNGTEGPWCEKGMLGQEVQPPIPKAIRNYKTLETNFQHKENTKSDEI